MGQTKSKKGAVPGHSFNLFIHSFIRKIFKGNKIIPEEIANIILKYLQHCFIEYQGKFLKENVGQTGMKILKRSDKSVICWNKGYGASAKLDAPLPKCGSGSYDVYFWNVRFLGDQYMEKFPMNWFGAQKFIGVVSDECKDFDTMIVPFVGYYGKKHKILKEAFGIGCDGKVYVDSGINNDIKNGRIIQFTEIIKVMYYVTDGLLVFKDENDEEFCRIPLAKNKVYFPIISAINNINNMEVVTFDMDFRRKETFEPYEQ